MKHTFDIDQLLNKRIFSSGSNSSRGQKQKILLERCFNKKKIYLMDESASNLGKESKAILIEKLKELRKKQKIIILVSHDEDFLKICDQVIC